MRIVLRLAAFLALVAAVAQAQDIRTEWVRFAPGASSAFVEGRIQGRETVDYLLNARAGQIANISMATRSTSASFNILAPGETEVAFFNGSMSDDQFEGPLPATGDYRVRVYLFRNAARAGESAEYRLEMIVSGGGATTRPPASPPAGFVEGDFYEVAGVGGGDALNLREGPSTSARVLARLGNGAILRNAGRCETQGQTRWCPVESEGRRGWVSARYLREPRPGGGAAT